MREIIAVEEEIQAALELEREKAEVWLKEEKAAIEKNLADRFALQRREREKEKSKLIEETEVKAERIRIRYREAIQALEGTDNDCLLSCLQRNRNVLLRGEIP